MTNSEQERAVFSEINAEIDDLMGECLPASDRAAVLIGAAILDNILEKLLVRVLLPSPNKADELFESDGPLSTFSARITLGFRMGLFDADTARVLHLIRKIRNDFAHEVKGCTLDTGPHRDRLHELGRLLSKDQWCLTQKKRIQERRNGGDGVADYVFAVLIAMRTLQIARANKGRINYEPTRLVNPG